MKQSDFFCDRLHLTCSWQEEPLLSVSLNNVLSCNTWINHVNAIDEILMICSHSAIPDLGFNVIFEPCCEKTGLRGFRPGPIQTGLYNHRR